MGELLAQVGDLVFSLVISYLGALEFYYVVRHLYHWSFRHPNEVHNDEDGLRHLQDDMRNKLASAAAKEAKAGANAMQDGVLYKDGFRINPQENARHNDEQKTEEEKQRRRKEIEAELVRQKKIEEDIRQQLEKAEAELEIERKKLAAEEEQRNAEALIMAERLKEEQQRQLEQEEQEREENERRILAAEETRAARQSQREEREKVEAERSIAAEQQRLEEARNARMAQFEVEREKEEQQRQLELTRAAEEEARRMVQAIREQEEQEKVAEENEQRLLEAERLREEEQRREEEERERLFLIESSIIPQQSEAEDEEQKAARLLLEAEREQERKQRKVEENARKFLEAEQEMVELQRQMEETVQQRHVPFNQQMSIVEEPCIKKVFKPLQETEAITQSVKTQFQQNSKSLLFPDVSDDGSSNEPNASSAQSSFSTLLTEEIAAQEREAPDGEDHAPDVQYTDEYLRSLDGIKQRPLVREDGSGRRRAFKKRRSSGSSNSSRDSRTSREEEVKMFTSLEEEEMHEEKKDDENFSAIKYSSEPTLKVKGHHRRHKRSPAKDVKPSDESLRSSLEKLNEEQTNPWGEVMPEHYKETEFWKREKAFSIDEEDVEHQIDITTVTPQLASFEKATQEQNENAITALQKQSTKDTEKQESHHVSDDTSRTNEINTNLHTSQNTERASSPARSSCSPRLRRSPRIDELDQYEEHERQTAAANSEAKNLPAAAGSPRIFVESATDTASWRDAHGLLMEGISDFYDFTASMNPSRSRPTSRNASRAGTPTSPKPEMEYPKNVACEHRAERTENLDVYDDTNTLQDTLKKDDLMSFLDRLVSSKEMSEPTQEICASDCLRTELKEVADDPNKRPDITMTMAAMPLVVINTADELIIEENLTANVSSTNRLTEFEVSGKSTQDNNSENNESSENDVNKTVETLRQERCRNRSRSSSPLPTSHNVERSIESRRQKRIQHNDELFAKLERTSPFEDLSKSGVETPTISLEIKEEKERAPKDTEETDLASSEMIGLVESLRVSRVRSRSRSKSPMRIPTEANVSHSVEVRRNKLIQQNDELLVQLTEKFKPPEVLPGDVLEGHLPSRSKTPDLVEKPENGAYKFVPSSNRRSNFEDNDSSVSNIQHLSNYYDFHQMLNLEASRNKTLAKNTEESESCLTVEQRLIDEEAIKKLQTSNNEVELLTFAPTDSADSVSDEAKASEQTDNLGRAFNKNTLRRLKCTPTTPDYDRSMSTELKDVQRIKAEILASGYKRSTYVGESMDLGSEYVDLRREAANFRRSQSRSRSPLAQEEQIIQLARDEAAEARQIQADILAEITTDLRDNSHRDVQDKHGAKPKTERKKSPIDLEHSFSRECADTQRIRDEQLSSGFQRSTYVGESLDMSSQYEEMRRDVAEFRRSRSKSRSPLDAKEVQMIAEIDAEAAKRKLQDQILDEITKTTINFQDFSRHLNADFLDNDRRASDSALMQKPEILFQLQDSDPDLDMDPEEYHHFRRYSLRQEEPIEEYPNDSDFMYMSQMEMCSPSGSRTWTREDYYSNNLENLRIEFPDILNSPEISAEELKDENAALEHDDEETDGSEDERRTVVDVDDEIDEDIGDFNERGTDESHHEQSECEEADREFDRYKDRRAEDWKNMESVMDVAQYEPRQNNFEVEEEGAVGGLSGDARSPYDSDSFAIDEIYDEAIRNRKQSGILRDYDNILQEMQPTNYIEDSDLGQGYEANWQNNVDRYALWAKTRELERGNSQLANSADSALNFIESERRYLGDAVTTARNSTRLRSRYGFMPVLQRTDLQETVMDVDLNYKPKREYNWRKNFKLDEDDGQKKEEPNNTKKDEIEDLNDMYEEHKAQLIDIRKFSLGGESITLFSRSPERELLPNVGEEDPAVSEPEIKDDKATDEAKNTKDSTEKTKKKKSKRKTRKESKENIDRYAKDEEDSESQTYSRRSSSIQMETDSPKRKTRSRRSSRNSLNNEESLVLYSPRGSIDEPVEGFTGEYPNGAAASQKKKTKKHKKAKESKLLQELEIKEEHFASEIPMELNLTEAKLSVSAAITPDSSSEVVGLLSTLSAPNSACVTPVSIESTDSNNSPRPKTPETATTAAATHATIDTFDILKDGNLYPLF